MCLPSKPYNIISNNNINIVIFIRFIKDIKHNVYKYQSVCTINKILHLVLNTQNDT